MIATLIFGQEIGWIDLAHVPVSGWCEVPDVTPDPWAWAAPQVWMSLHERQVPIDVGDYPASAGTRVALIQDVDNIANRERKPKIQQHRKAPST